MITLYVKNGTAHVWNSDDWYVLRSQHRICGSLIGTIASHPRQNDFMGLPMALMSEEAALLVEQEICELVELPNLCDKISAEQRSEIKQCEKQVFDEQISALRKRKIEQLTENIDKIVAGKTKKMHSKGITDVQLDKDVLLQEEIDKMPKLAPAYMLIHLPTQHFSTAGKQVISINGLKPSVTDKEGSIRYSIFKDLWEKGHYITSGSKFGCDFLVYPGDPVKFHASYMVRCIYDNETLLRPTTLVAFGRLSVAVNKLAVLAYSDCYGNIEYQTLQWHDSIA